MKYSIIIPYRNREEHLNILLPQLIKVCANLDYEIIISEQADNDNFRIACVENIGVTIATGDVFIFNQVDYVPTDDVSYTDGSPFRPAKRGIFLIEDMTAERPIEDIPGGYRQWRTQIPQNFYGGVLVLSREHFEKVNGFNPLYIGWGNEDEDMRARIIFAKLPVIHGNGTFYILYHNDSGNIDPVKEPQKFVDYVEGRTMCRLHVQDYLHIGYKNLTADIDVFNLEGYTNVKWVKSKNYKITL